MREAFKEGMSCSSFSLQLLDNVPNDVTLKFDTLY